MRVLNRARDLMSSGVATCRPDDSVNTAARLMWEHDCGCVPVVTGDGILVGMITDRDICMAAYTQGRRLEEIKVSRVMAKAVQSIAPDDTIESALQRMAEYQVRRLPVVDHWHHVIGILSLNDIARRAGPKERAALGAAVAAIGMHREELLRPAKLSVARPPVRRSSPPPARRASSNGRSEIKAL